MNKHVFDNKIYNISSAYFTSFKEKRTNGKKRPQMRYPCVPEWMKTNERDDFDYPLRSKEEIKFDQLSVPLTFPLENEIRTYAEPYDIKMEAKYDIRNEIVSTKSLIINRLECHFSLIKWI